MPLCIQTFSMQHLSVVPTIAYRQGCVHRPTVEHNMGNIAPIAEQNMGNTAPTAEHIMGNMCAIVEHVTGYVFLPATFLPCTPLPHQHHKRTGWPCCTSCWCSASSCPGEIRGIGGQMYAGVWLCTCVCVCVCVECVAVWLCACASVCVCVRV